MSCDAVGKDLTIRIVRFRSFTAYRDVTLLGPAEVLNVIAVLSRADPITAYYSSQITLW